MTRNEATARLKEIRKELNAIQATRKNAVELYKAGKLTDAGWVELRTREDALEAEFKTVSKFAPSI